VVLLVSSQGFGESIAERVGLGTAFGWLVRLLAWPLLLGLMMTGAAVAYWLAPDVGLPFKWVTPGAVLFAVAAVVTSLLLGVYIGNFGSYNETYGTLGGAVVLLLWFYVTGLIFLLGAEVNALLDEHTHGPVLAERRQAALDAVRKKREKQPANPDALAPPEGGDGDAHPRNGKASPDAVSRDGDKSRVKEHARR
jgi:membrane protein